MEEVFGPDGLIAKAHSEYEYRPGQIQMAQAVMRAFEEKRHLIVEAGTGTGKTLAYLVPAVAAALGGNGRVIVSTGTKNLQEQLMEKDIPFLQGVLPKRFAASYMKGRSNYVCPNRLGRAQSAPVLEGLDEVDYFEEVTHWSTETETGDRAELATLPESLSFWRHIDARSEACLGQKCPDFDPCYITRMRNRAQEADIVVVNHHLFFADLSLRNGNYGSVLPDYTAVILDEAHLIEDVASEYFGSQVSNYQIDDLVRDLGMIPIDDVQLDQELTRSVARMARFADDFWMGFRDGRGDEGRYPIIPGTFARRNVHGEFEATHLGELYSILENAIARVETTLETVQENRPRLKRSFAVCDRSVSIWSLSSPGLTRSLCTGWNGEAAACSCARRRSTSLVYCKTSCSTKFQQLCSRQQHFQAAATFLSFAIWEVTRQAGRLCRNVRP